MTITNYNHSHTIAQEETDVNETNKQSMYCIKMLLRSLESFYSSSKEMVFLLQM